MRSVIFILLACVACTDERSDNAPSESQEGQEVTCLSLGGRLEDCGEDADEWNDVCAAILYSEACLAALDELTCDELAAAEPPLAVQAVCLPPCDPGAFDRWCGLDGEHETLTLCSEEGETLVMRCEWYCEQYEAPYIGCGVSFGAATSEDGDDLCWCDIE
jgi:hypothetical protein